MKKFFILIATASAILKKEEIDHSSEYFVAGEDGIFNGSGYLRVTPLRFASDDGDVFMRSMIQNYALE